MNYTFFKIGFELNLISKNELISFSEKEIEKNYNDFHLDIISLTKESESIKFIEILNFFSTTTLEKGDFLKTHPIFIYFIFKEKEEDWLRQRDLILRYYSFFNFYLDEMDYEFWSRLKDDFNLRKEGFSGCMEMPNEMISHFNKELEREFTGTFFENLILCLRI